MRRLGKSVEELAREAAEEILGFPGTGDETIDALEGTGGHKPPRADIQKMKDVYDLYTAGNEGLRTQVYDDRGPAGDPGDANADAINEWNRDYALTKQEQSFIDAYTHMFKYNGAQKAFEQLGRLIQMGMIKDGELLGGEDAATEPLPPEVKRAAGALLKKYEELHYAQLYPAIVRTLTKLEREHPESYKLWPWAIKQMKAEYQERLESGNISNIGQGGLRFDHLADIVGEGGALLNRLRAENRLPQGLDVNRINFDEFETWLMQWKRDNREQEAQGEIVYEYHDGWTMQKLTTPEQLQFEGDEMGHCVGGYSHSVGEGKTIIYSLRDPKGMPHVTMEINALEGAPSYGFAEGEEPPEDVAFNHEYIHPDKHAPGDHAEESNSLSGYQPTGETPFEVVQVQGNSNKTPKPEYQHKIKDFLDSLRAKGWKFVRSDEWFAPFDDPAQREYGDGAPDTAQELDEWYDDHYKTHHEQYRGTGDGDAYGLPAERATIGISDWAELFKSCFSALVEEYDPGRWRGRPEDLAQAVYHAWAVDIYKDKLDPEALKQHEKNLVEEIQSAEETLSEWEDNQWDYGAEHHKDEIAEKFEEIAKQRGEWAKIKQALDEEHGGEDMWDEDEIYNQGQDLDEDVWYEANDAVRQEEMKYYSGDAWKFIQYLIFLAEKHGMVNPADLPDPNQRNGGLPSYEELEQMPWKTDERVPTNTGETPVEEGLPGALSAWQPISGANDIQIHPIDQEHNVWFDEDGNQRARYRPGWAKDPATGKMVQTGQPEDSFLDKQGRQGEGYVAYHGDQPVGSLTYVSDPNGWHMIGTTFVHPDYREQGLFNRMAEPLRATGQPVDAYVWNNPWLKQKVRGWQTTAMSVMPVWRDLPPQENRGDGGEITLRHAYINGQDAGSIYFTDTPDKVVIYSVEVKEPYRQTDLFRQLLTAANPHGKPLDGRMFQNQRLKGLYRRYQLRSTP